MKIQKGMPIGSFDLQNARLKQTKNPIKGQQNKEFSSFESMLENKINSMSKNNALPENLPPIDKNYLAQLTQIVQKQMNESLLHAFGDSESNSSYREDMGLRGIEHLMNTAISGMNSNNTSQNTKTAPSQTDIEQIIKKASARYDVDPDLTRAVVKAESDFNPGCTSSKGAMGLMQLMPPTARELGVQNPYDPGENVYAGTRYLKQLLDRYDGDVNTALSAYNWGMGNVERNPGKLPQETRTYITRVNRYYQEAKQGA
jgi:soluble lytic murein transglycosylase-like protein